MKKIILLLAVIFFILTLLVCFCPIVTQWDRSIIILVQEKLKNLPVYIAVFPDFRLYLPLIILPLVVYTIYFFKKYLIIDMVIFLLLPLFVFSFNTIFKHIINRPRPTVDLQILLHPSSPSYVSNHTLTTFCIWGAVIYYLNKYCKNKVIKYLGITVAVFWMLFVGLSRIWLGVHYPSDVVGAYILGLLILLIFISVSEKIGGKNCP